MNPYELALTNHNPEPAGSPAYIPWWARGEYAKQHGTSWQFPDGTSVRGGQVVKRGHGRRVEVQQLSSPHPTPEKRSEVPREPSATPDRARELWTECNGRSERVALLRRYNIDPSILEDAPNPGVASMRGLNALRKVLE